MLTLIWPHQKDPDSNGTFALEWGDFLDGATIVSSSWVVPTGVTSSADGNDDFDAFIRIAGGTDGIDYQFDNTVIDSNGDEWQRSVTLQVRER